MPGKHRTHPGFLEKWMERLRPELVVRRRDALRFPNWKMQKDEDRPGLGFPEIVRQPAQLGGAEVAPAFLLGVIQQHKVAITPIERLVELSEPPTVNSAGLLGMRVMVSRHLIVGNLDGFDDRLIFVPLRLLARGAVAIDQVAKVDDQNRLQRVDLRDQALERDKTLALESRASVADDDKLKFTGRNVNGRQGQGQQSEQTSLHCFNLRWLTGRGRQNAQHTRV
jgi:hypothetical protein